MSFCISMTSYRPVGTRGAQYVFSASALRLVQYSHRTLFHVVFSTHQYNNTNNHRDIQCLIHHYWNILQPLQFKTDIRSSWKGCDHTVAIDTAAQWLASLWQAWQSQDVTFFSLVGTKLLHLKSFSSAMQRDTPNTILFLVFLNRPEQFCTKNLCFSDTIQQKTVVRRSCEPSCCWLCLSLFLGQDLFNVQVFYWELNYPQRFPPLRSKWQNRMSGEAASDD